MDSSRIVFDAAQQDENATRKIGGRLAPCILAEASMRVARVVEEHSAEETENLLVQLDEAMQTRLPRLRYSPPATRAIGHDPVGLHWANFFPYDIQTVSSPSEYPCPISSDIYRLDFLCFAIQNGLYHHVRLKMVKAPGMIKHRGLPLLSCACGPVPNCFRPRPGPI